MIQYVKEERSIADDEGNIIAEATRRITSKATKRIASTAFALAAQRAKKDASVTVVHKSNVLQVTDGLFRTTCRETYDKEGWEAKGVKYNEQIVDSMVYKLFREPWQFDVVVAPNLYGDILSYPADVSKINRSDGAAALVGSLGLVPSINLSPTLVIGEPVHGSAPDIQGKGIANPIAAIRSAGMMLAQLGWVEEGNVIENAVRGTLEAGIVTPDLGGTNTTEDVTKAVIERLA
jgi:homoisocitrate dehydrogenase